MNTSHLSEKGAPRIVATLLALALTALSACSWAAGTTQATMRVSATVIPINCPSGTVLPSCIYPARSVSNVGSYAAVDTRARDGVPISPHKIDGRLSVVTLIY